MIKTFAIAAFVSAAMIGTSWSFWQEAAPSRSNSNPGLRSRSFEPSTTLISSPTVTLLSTREVQTELKLEEVQAKKIDEVSAEITRERARFMAEYNRKLGELNMKSADQAFSVLNDAQRQRLDQIRLQQQGLQVLTTKAIAEKLGLTQQQRDEIAKLTQPSSPPGRGDAPDRTTNTPDPNVPAAERFRVAVEEANKRAAETREKILAVLTPEQKAKWAEMTGQSFQLPRRQRSSTRGASTPSSEPAQPSAEKKAP